MHAKAGDDQTLDELRALFTTRSAELLDVSRAIERAELLALRKRTRGRMRADIDRELADPGCLDRELDGP